MKDPEVCDYLARLARQDGAVYPCIDETTGGDLVVIDTDSGRTWKIEIKEF